MQKLLLHPGRAIFYIFSFALAIFSSCSDKSKGEADVLIAMQENLNRSNTAIQFSTEISMKSLSEKRTDPCTKERAEKWYTTAELVIDSTKKICDYLEDLKNRNKWDYSILGSVISKLNNYKRVAFTADSSIMKEFGEGFSFIDRFISLANSVKETELKSNSVLPLLTLLKNDLKIIENKITTYCNSKVGCTIMTFDSYATIVGQNSNYLKPGSILEINAGVGAFSRSAAQPKITINGVTVKLGEEGYSTYKMKVPKQPGNYNIPVEIKFFNQTIGKEEQKRINVEYTVAKECDQ